MANIILNGDKLYKELSVDNIEIDKFKSTFDSDYISFVDNNNDDISEKESKIIEIDDELRNESKFPSLSRFNSLLSSSFTNELLNNRQEIYDLGRDYGVSIETINKCGTNLTPKQLNDFRAMFDYIDLDKSGDISINEFMDIFGRINDENEWTKNDIHEFLKKVDKNNNGELDFNQFLIMMTGSLSLQFNKKNVLKAFQTFSEQPPNQHLVDIHKLTNNLKQLFNVIDPDLLKNNIGDDSKINKNEIDGLLQLLPVSENGLFNIKSFLDSIM